MSKKNKEYDSTTPDPTRPEKNDPTPPTEHPDKTRKKEKNDPTKTPDPDITSTPGNARNTNESNGTTEGSWLNRTEV